MLRAAENNYAIESNWLFDEATLETLSSFVQQHEGKRLPQLLVNVPDEIEPHELQLFLKSQNRASAAAVSTE